mgnify:CR=1 FL=1
MKKETKKAPTIRFRGFTDDWKQRKLGDIVDFLDTQRKPLTENIREKGPYPYYGASGIVDYVAGYIFDEELVLLSEDGANITDRNYPVCFLASGKYWVNNHAHVLKTKEGIDNNFICNSLECKDFSIYNTGMAMPKLNQDICKRIPVDFPTYDEQENIGNYFRDIDYFITLHQRKLDQLKKLKKYFLQNMFPAKGEKVPRIRFKGFTGDWEQRKLGDICGVYDGIHQTPDYQEDGVMFLSVENIATLTSEKYISEDAYNRNYKAYPEKGDILMTRIGDVGTPHVVETNEKLAYYVSLALLKPKGIDSYFLNNAIQTSPFQKGLLERTLLTAIPMKINKDEIGKVDISFPVNISEQKQIGSYFRNLDNLITLHQRKLNQLQTMKKFMLQNLFI